MASYSVLLDACVLYPQTLRDLMLSLAGTGGSGTPYQIIVRTYRDSRAAATVQVEEGIRLTHNLTTLTPNALRRHPGVLQMLRMATCPPLARDRLVGLAYTSKNLVSVMEEKNAIPRRMPAATLQENLTRIADVITRMLDLDIFPWITSKQHPTEEERYRASTIVADRLCGAVSDPIIRNAQEKRQLDMIGEYLQARGYRQKPHPANKPLNQMEPGTFTFRMNVVVGSHQWLSWVRGRRRDRLDMGTPHQRPGPIGDMTVLDIEAQRQTIQERLDAARTAAERNRLGQFATPPDLALDIARYALSLWQARTAAVAFLDPAIGTGSFYSALRRVFPPQAIADACGVEIDPPSPPPPKASGRHPACGSSPAISRARPRPGL